MSGLRFRTLWSDKACAISSSVSTRRVLPDEIAEPARALAYLARHVTCPHLVVTALGRRAKGHVDRVSAGLGTQLGSILRSTDSLWPHRELVRHPSPASRSSRFAQLPQ